MGTKVPSIHIQIPHILQAFIIISDHWAIKSIAVSLTHNVRHVFYYVSTCTRSVWPHITRNTAEGVTTGSSMLYVPLCVSYISLHYLFSCAADTALQCTILFNDKTLKIVKIVMSKNCKWYNTFTLADRVTTSICLTCSWRTFEVDQQFLRAAFIWWHWATANTINQGHQTPRLPTKIQGKIFPRQPIR